MLTKEKEGMEKAIELQLERKREVLTNEQTSDEDFTRALLDVCTLNKLRDAVGTPERRPSC